ncbi:glycogen synthase [Aerococcus urinaehominis]|uniref:Glycogen synthase n=1 Tax=Aerococcus urinaehominis TaxID=128944 RepID=A0A120IAP7_9LACT|nr:glycogen synthase GlgA [Aerococcus urinaehominis]AMB98768.1 glycogen synthase [Aerococcus urinaehominis]SDM13417.1 starch synthase [Aerococcus urinaehominis]
MKILFAASESAPFFKSGGLGDVAYALPKELKKQGIDIRVVLPLYNHMAEKYKQELTHVVDFEVELGHYRRKYVGVEALELDGVTYYFIDNKEYFDRGVLYGEPDEGERFGYFDLAVIEMMEKIDFIPNIIHCNDWQTAMIPALLVDKYHWVEAYRDIRKILTIHNIRFQGWYPSEILYDVFNTTMSLFHPNGAQAGNMVNFMKAGINFSDIVTTVSPNYAGEIQTPEFGEGLDGVLRQNSWKIRGIINGIDYDINNPATDANIVENYELDTAVTGKRANKVALQERLGLAVDPDLPLMGVVSRLTDQKGMQLIEAKAEEIINTQDVQIVILGTGDAQFENSFRFFEWKYPGIFCAYIDFDVALAQQIYAASDIFLMPSAFEPCGLSQMISMRYGTLPLVHETGGLKDTVTPYNQYTGTGNGFSFGIFNDHTFAQTVYYALDVYNNQPEAWEKLIYQAMTTDFRWVHPAGDYIAIYQDLLDE